MTGSSRCAASNSEFVTIARRVAREVGAVVRNTRRKLRRSTSGRARFLVEELARTAALTGKIAVQTAERLAGGVLAGSSRIVSLYDPDARPIKKGRLGKPVEFGYKAQLVDNEDGAILDHNVEIGHPADASMLEPKVRRIKVRTGRAPAPWIVVVAKPDSCDHLVKWASATSCCHEGKSESRLAGVREATVFPGDGPMEDRIRGTDQPRKTRRRPGPDPPRRD